MRRYYRVTVIFTLLILCTFLGITLRLQRYSALEDLSGSEYPWTSQHKENKPHNLEGSEKDKDVDEDVIVGEDYGEPAPEKNPIFEINLKKKMEEIESENSRRLEKVEAVCRKYGLGLYKNPEQPSELKHPPTPQYQVFFFDKVHKWSLCPIYKAGSTSWLYNLLLLAGLSSEEIDNSGKTLSDLARENYPELDPPTAEQELRRTTKIMTVRHPFERVLSAYRDKLENINHGWEHGTKHFYQAYGQKIVKKYRPGGSGTLSQDFLNPNDVLRDPKLPEPSGVEPTFQEFIRYLIDSNLVSKSDDHWIPYYLYCTPCLLHYEFIAKTETLGPDQTYVIRALGLNEKIKARWRHKTQFTDSDDPNQVSEVAKIYFHQLATARILQLYEKYRIDFELFGYDFTPYLQYAKDAPTG